MTRFKSHFNKFDDCIAMTIPNDEIPDLLDALESASAVDWVREMKEKLKENGIIG